MSQHLSGQELFNKLGGSTDKKPDFAKLKSGTWLIDPARNRDWGAYYAEGTMYPFYLSYDFPKGPPVVQASFDAKVLAGTNSYVLAKHQPRRLAVEGRRIRLASCQYNISMYLGTDPELFVVKADGKAVPAFEFLPDSKHDTIYWDGWQAEFSLTNSGPPAHCMDTTGGYIWSKLKRLNALKPVGTTLRAWDEVPVTSEELAAAKEEHVAFGCAPSYNAYGHCAMPIPDPRRLLRRFAGGHLHFGLEGVKYSQEQMQEAVKCLDAIAGVMCVSLFPTDSPRRRQYYGLAGEYRLPSHGLEYRTLSNSWLRAPQLWYLVMGTARGAVRMGLAGNRSILRGREREITECINNCDVQMARRLIRRNRDVYQSIWQISHDRDDPRGVKTMKFVLAGADKWFPRDSNLADTWSLGAGAFMWSNTEYRPGGWGATRFGPFIRTLSL